MAEPHVETVSTNNFVTILRGQGVDYLVSQREKVRLTSLDDRAVFLFFSANWCRPCKNFIPQLVQVYNKLLSDRENLEIVFVSYDRDEDGFKEHFKCMPWLAVPFDVDLNKKLSEAYRVDRIPSLVSLNFNGTLMDDDIIGFIEDYGAEAYPFSRMRRDELRAMDDAKRQGVNLEQLLSCEGRNYVISRDAKEIPISDLAGKTIGLYFGAHWCPPSRTFTLQLTEAYSEIVATRDHCFEVILVSTDRDLKEFNLNLSTMPWLAVPYEDRTRLDLCRIFNIKGIPALVIIGQDGTTTTTDGNAMISLYGAKAFPFTNSRIQEIEAELNIEGDALPQQLKDINHEHELKLNMVNAYVCDCCKGKGRFWAFSCDICDYDLHPACVIEVLE